MFLPEVTNSLLPTTLAPVVSPTSCLIEPRYSTLSDITASGRGGAGGSAVADSAVVIMSATALAIAMRIAADRRFETLIPTPKPFGAQANRTLGPRRRFSGGAVKVETRGQNYLKVVHLIPQS